MQEFIKEMDLNEDTSHYHVEKILSLSEAMPDHRRPIRNSTTVPAKGIKEVTQFEELTFNSSPTHGKCGSSSPIAYAGSRLASHSSHFSHAHVSE